MQCKEMKVVFGQEGLAHLPEEARAHISACDSCQNLFADLSTIVSLAHDLPAEVDPPARVWHALRAQLEAEGLIATPTPNLQGAPWWHSFAQLFRSRTLATAAVGFLIVAAAALQMRTPVVTEPQSSSPDPIFNTATVLNEQERGLTNMQLAGTSTADTSLRQNLQTLNEFIADCEEHLRQYPGDTLAREYLSSAYQQKADLLSAIMERGGSEH